MLGVIASVMSWAAPRPHSEEAPATNQSTTTQAQAKRRHQRAGREAKAARAPTLAVPDATTSDADGGRPKRARSPHPFKRKSEQAKSQKQLVLVDKSFDAAKQSVLGKLESCIDNSIKDNSKKGGVDAPIANLMDIINTHPDYVTTSSCSGRVAIFSESDQARKQTGVWLLASHETIDFDDVKAALTGDKLPADYGTIWFKFEPVILHIQCRSIEQAKALFNTAIGAGMKNSGIMLGKKIMVAVRCSLKIEAPIGDGGKLLVDDAHLHALVAMTKNMYVQNEQRKNRFERDFVSKLCPAESTA